MNRLISVISFVLAVSGTAYGVYWGFYVIGFRKKNLRYVTAFLEKAECKKNVFRGHPFSGKWHKYWTEYTYSYRVDGRPYRICGGRSGQKQDLPHQVTVAVQKNAPKNSVIPQWERAPSKWSILYFWAGCAVLYVASVYLWYL